MTGQQPVVHVVDDDASVRRAFERLLRAAGFDPVSYASAENYWEDPASAPPDCLVLDVQLRGMSGFDLRDRLAACGTVPPIIFITAHENPETQEQARQAGCVALLYKPVAGGPLLEAIRRVLGPGQGGNGQGEI